MKYGIDTRCQHLADDNKDEIYGAISYPIYQSATFARDRVGGGSGYDYSRLQNPTREHLEKIVASLEEGIDALVIHGRTVEQRYRGKADWDTLASVKARFPSATIIGRR